MLLSAEVLPKVCNVNLFLSPPVCACAMLYTKSAMQVFMNGLEGLCPSREPL